MENNVYQVYNEHYPKEILFTGNIWDCEHWVTKNGVINTPYVIDRVDNKKPVEKRTKSNNTEIKALF